MVGIACASLLRACTSAPSGSPMAGSRSMPMPGAAVRDWPASLVVLSSSPLSTKLLHVLPRPPRAPSLKGGRLYDGSRVDKVWTYDDESAFDDRPKHLLLPLMLAIWTARRQGDLLYLQWSAYDGTFIRLRQRKTGKRVTIPVGGPLKLALDAEKTNPRNDGKSVVLTILMNSMGRPWTADGFRTSWRKPCQTAGVPGLTFHYLRGSAITRLALAGATVPEIANRSGLSLGDVRGILDKHYQNDDVQLGQNAIRKLEALKDSKG